MYRSVPRSKQLDVCVCVCVSVMYRSVPRSKQLRLGYNKTHNAIEHNVYSCIVYSFAWNSSHSNKSWLYVAESVNFSLCNVPLVLVRYGMKLENSWHIFEISPNNMKTVRREQRCSGRTEGRTWQLLYVVLWESLQTGQLMLYREIMAVCSEIHTKHINTVCGQNLELLNDKLPVHIVTTGLQRVTSLV